MNLQKINKFLLILILVIFILCFYSRIIIGSENSIIFKIKDKAYTTLDYEKRLEYLDFVGNNNNISRDIILNDFISANLFFEYYKNINDKSNYDKKINQIYNNVIEINKNNNKVYKYELNKENLLQNIKLDFIRKNILERIMNSNIENLNQSSEIVDLLYSFKLNYINFELSKNNNLKFFFENLKNLRLEEIVDFLEKQDINFFIKEQEINNLNKVDSKIKNKILGDEKIFYLEDRNKISIFFVEKKFETMEGIIVKLYSLKSLEEVNREKLKCINLKENNDPNLINKNYNFSELNKELRNKLIDINDFVKIKKNNENIYIILCGIKFDREKLDNINLNKLINLNVTDIETRFINKYSKVFNLILNEF